MDRKKILSDWPCLRVESITVDYGGNEENGSDGDDRAEEVGT